MMSSSPPPDSSLHEEYIAKETSTKLSSAPDKSMSDILYLNGSLSRNNHSVPRLISNGHQKLVLSNISKEMFEMEIGPNSLLPISRTSNNNNNNEKECNGYSFNNNNDGNSASVVDEDDKSLDIARSNGISNCIISKVEEEFVENELPTSKQTFTTNKLSTDVLNKLENTVNNYSFETEKSPNFEAKLQNVSCGNNGSEDCDTDGENIGCDGQLKNPNVNNDNNNNSGGNNDCENVSNSDSCDNAEFDEVYRVPKAPIFNGNHNFKIKGSLKRKAEDCDEGENDNPKRKRTIKFDSVTVFYFPRSQGFNCVPSQGGSTLGMSRKHFSIKSFSLQEHAAEQRRLHRDLLTKLKQQKNKMQKNCGNYCSSSEESEENSEEASDISDSELETESFYFLQPLPIRKRRALLRQSGIGQIEGIEKDECKDIRNSRELCGCQCKIFCDPATCQCSLAGIKCQVDRHNFPCGCSRECCKNENGRIEFNPIRVRTHFLHTLMRLEIEKCQAHCQQQWEGQQHCGSTTIPLNPISSCSINQTRHELHHPGLGLGHDGSSALSWSNGVTHNASCSLFDPSSNTGCGGDFTPFSHQGHSIMLNNSNSQIESASSIDCSLSSSGLYSLDSRLNGDCNLSSNSGLVLPQSNLASFGLANNALYTDNVFQAFDSSSSFVPYCPTPSSSMLFPSHNSNSNTSSGFIGPSFPSSLPTPKSTSESDDDTFIRNIFPYSTSSSCSQSVTGASCMAVDRFSSSIQNIYHPHSFTSTALTTSNIPGSGDTSGRKVGASFSLSDVLGDLGSEASCDDLRRVGPASSSTLVENVTSSEPHSNPLLRPSNSTDCMLSRVNGGETLLRPSNPTDCMLSGGGNYSGDNGNNQNNIAHIFPSQNCSSITGIASMDVLSDFDSLAHVLLKPPSSTISAPHSTQSCLASNSFVATCSDPSQNKLNGEYPQNNENKGVIIGGLEKSEVYSDMVSISPLVSSSNGNCKKEVNNPEPPRVKKDGKNRIDIDDETRRANIDNNGSFVRSLSTESVNENEHTSESLLPDVESLTSTSSSYSEEEISSSVPTNGRGRTVVDHSKSNGKVSSSVDTDEPPHLSCFTRENYEEKFVEKAVEIEPSTSLQSLVNESDERAQQQQQNFEKVKQVLNESKENLMTHLDNSERLSNLVDKLMPFESAKCRQENTKERTSNSSRTTSISSCTNKYQTRSSKPQSDNLTAECSINSPEITSTCYEKIKGKNDSKKIVKSKKKSNSSSRKMNSNSCSIEFSSTAKKLVLKGRKKTQPKYKNKPLLMSNKLSTNGEIVPVLSLKDDRCLSGSSKEEKCLPLKDKEGSWGYSSSTSCGLENTSKTSISPFKFEVEINQQPVENGDIFKDLPNSKNISHLLPEITSEHLPEDNALSQLLPKENAISQQLPEC